MRDKTSPYLGCVTTEPTAILASSGDSKLMLRTPSSPGHQCPHHPPHHQKTLDALGHLLSFLACNIFIWMIASLIEHISPHLNLTWCNLSTCPVWATCLLPLVTFKTPTMPNNTYHTSFGMQTMNKIRGYAGITFSITDPFLLFPPFQYQLWHPAMR